MNTIDHLTEIPAELKALPNWVAWKLVERDGSLTKPPFIVGTNRHASSTDPSTWTTYEAAIASVAATGIGKENGLGFAIGGAALDLNLIAIDIDGCRDTDGTIAPWADELLTAAGGYTEITPSETGLRIIGTGKLRKDQETFDIDPAAGFGEKVKIECFADRKYITVTGEPLFEDAGEIEPLDMPAIYAVIDGIQKKHPVATTMKAKGTASTASSAYTGGVQIERNGGPFTTHYELFMHGTLTGDKPCVISDGLGNTLTYSDKSGADLAFANHFALKHGDDPDAIWNDYVDSCIARPKWLKREDYFRANTIAKGIAFATKFRERTSKVSTSTDATVNQIEPVQPIQEDLEEQVWPDPRFAMTQEELDAQDAEDVEHPIWKLRETAGPNFDDALLYGPLGDVTRRLCEFSEANTGAVYLNLLVSFGSMIGRQAYFNVGATRHYLNEFLACVGSSSIGRKGTASDVADSFLHLINAHWLSTNNVTGFSTPQAVISQIKDASVFKKFDKATKEYSDVEQPGVVDKRLCIREGELSNVFKLMSDPKTKAAELIRNLWDGKGVSNIVAGKSADGENNSLQCKEPHVSIIGSSTPSLVKSTMPVGAALSGDGNRFLWCYVKRTQLAPQGGRPVDFSKLYTTHVDSKGKKREMDTFVYFTDILDEFGVLDVDGDEDPVFYPLTKAANKHWNKVYCDQETTETAGFLGGMTSRSAPHIRRLATILCVIDRERAVDVKHLKAAEDIWDYTQRCAQYIFKGYSVEQYRILMLAKERGSTGIRLINVRDLFSRNKPGEWIRAQVKGLVDDGYLTASREGNRNVIFRFKRE